MRLRRVVAALAAVATIGMAPPQPAAATTGPAGKVDPNVRAQVTGGRSATFWVLLRGGDHLVAARQARGKAKAAAVLRDARAGADADQAGLRALFARRKARYRAYWIADTMQVTGDAALMRAIAARPEVKAVLPDEPVRLPDERTGTARAQVTGAEWNVDRIGAPRVWDELGDAGDGIVVANVDSGVQFDHPALAANYRGRNDDGSVSHDYNWFDPTGICAGGEPCDNVGHGTHTMGTMAGAGGTGVAPGARWIAAKGCETLFCSVGALLAAGEWIVAPTDRTGENPRPDLAPDVVNNSWGGAVGFDPWYSEVVQAWVAAGIFPAFSAGNDGPACGTTGAPGSYADAYTSGAFDTGGAIAAFSGRGGGLAEAGKPNIAAPGVDVRSSVPGGYEVMSGTSMASPHTAATVALMWSAAPALRGDIATTREILDETAVDTADPSCGGTAAVNNVWGQGRLDAYAAVALAAGPSGSLAGTVAAGGFPLGGATVEVSGPAGRTASTGTAGDYSFGRLLAGTYHVRVSAFGYDTVDCAVRVTGGGAARFDLSLTASAAAAVSGTVALRGVPQAGITVALDGTPVTVVTGDDGRFRLVAPLGEYDLTAEPPGGCSSAAGGRVRLAADVVLDLELPPIADGFGYTCAAATEPYRPGDHQLALAGDDSAVAVPLPFAFPLYGTGHDHAWVSINGMITFDAAVTSYANTGLPDTGEPNDALYPFWDDLSLDDEASVWTASAPDAFVVEWRNMPFFASAGQRVSVSAVLHPDGTVTYRYRDVVGERAGGTSATIGLEGPDGADGLAYAYAKQAVTEGSGVTLRPPAPSS
jgi:subtilisin family serine protease